MAKKEIYKITIMNWADYNPIHKKGFKKLMIPNNFLYDARLRAVPVTVRWMYLGLLLICSDHARDTVECSERQLRDILESSKSIDRALESLQSLQLVTYEKTLLIKGIELKEEKRIKKNTSEVEVLEKAPSKNALKKIDSEQNKSIKEAYINAFRLRYGVEPATNNAAFNSQVSNLRKKIGVDKSVELVKFYLTHEDFFFVKNTHSFGICLSKAETLYTQMQRDERVTNTVAKSHEKKNQMKELFDQIDEAYKTEEREAKNVES